MENVLSSLADSNMAPFKSIAAKGELKNYPLVHMVLSSIASGENTKFKMKYYNNNNYFDYNSL